MKRKNTPGNVVESSARSWGSHITMPRDHREPKAKQNVGAMSVAKGKNDPRHMQSALGERSMGGKSRRGY